MYRFGRRSTATVVAALSLVMLCWCRQGNEFSKQELNQIKAGRTQMPVEGRKMMEDIAAGRAKNPGPPPPNVGQPGPGGPVGSPIRR